MVLQLAHRQAATQIWYVTGDPTKHCSTLDTDIVA